MEIKSDQAVQPLKQDLLAGLASLHLTQDQQNLSDPLLSFLALLSKWNQAYNLTSVRDPKEMLSLHLLDCLAAVTPIEAYLGSAPTQLIDVGSGGGLPGIVFGLAWPNCEHHLVETVGKKVAFLQQCKLRLKLTNLQAHHHRIESFKLEQATPNRIFTCRAFASLSDFVAQTWHLRQPKSVWIALKGQRPDQEIIELERLAALKLGTKLRLQVKEIHPPSLENASRHLLFIEAETK
jgi:16S rRNA (guanine527-N7)-methyltransferase